MRGTATKSEVLQALVEADWNKTAAAGNLGMSRATLYRWMSCYGFHDSARRTARTSDPGHVQGGIRVALALTDEVVNHLRTIAAQDWLTSGGVTSRPSLSRAVEVAVRAHMKTAETAAARRA